MVDFVSGSWKIKAIVKKNKTLTDYFDPKTSKECLREPIFLEDSIFGTTFWSSVLAQNVALILDVLSSKK